MSYENLLLSENVRSAFTKFWKTVENIAKEAIPARLIDVKVTWVSNYKKLKSDTWNWTPTWSRSDYVTNSECGEPITNENFGIHTITMEINWRTRDLFTWFG